MCLTVPWRLRRSSSVLREECKLQSEQLSSLRCVISACGLQRQLFSEIQLVSPARCLSAACSLQHEVPPCKGADLMQLPWTWSTLRSPCRRASWGFPGEEILISQCSCYGWYWAEARKPSQACAGFGKPCEMHWAVDLSPQLQCCTKNMLHLAHKLSLNGVCWQQCCHMTVLSQFWSDRACCLFAARSQSRRFKMHGFSTLWFVAALPAL